MRKNRIVKYTANTALLAVVAAAGIGAYQLGTSKPQEIREETEIIPDEESMVDAGTSQVEADLDNSSGELAGEGITEDELQDSENQGNASAEDAGVTSESEDEGSVSATPEPTAAETAAGAVSAPQLSFSESTQMDWPVHGNILLDYNMDQTVYFATLDQYKLSPAIAVQAVEGAPVLASVPGTVYSIEENVQTGTTVTMELGDGYQVVYGQLTDLAVEEGQTVEKGAVIGNVAPPTKYYSEEGSNLYFAMKKDGKPIDPIAYLPE